MKLLSVYTQANLTTKAVLLDTTPPKPTTLWVKEYPTPLQLEELYANQTGVTLLQLDSILSEVAPFLTYSDVLELELQNSKLEDLLSFGVISDRYRYPQRTVLAKSLDNLPCQISVTHKRKPKAKGYSISAPISPDVLEDLSTAFEGFHD